MKNNVAIIILLSLILFGCSNKKNDYEQAVNLFNNSDFESAYTIFSNLKDYKDANLFADECIDCIIDLYLEECDFTSLITFIDKNINYIEEQETNIYNLCLNLKSEDNSNNIDVLEKLKECCDIRNINTAKINKLIDETKVNNNLKQISTSSIGQEISFGNYKWTIIDKNNSSALIICNEIVFKDIISESTNDTLMSLFTEAEGKAANNSLVLLTRKDFNEYSSLIPKTNDSWWLNDISSVTRKDPNGKVHNLRYYIVGKETSENRGTQFINDEQIFGARSFSYLDNNLIGIRPCFWINYNGIDNFVPSTPNVSLPTNSANTNSSSSTMNKDGQTKMSSLIGTWYLTGSSDVVLTVKQSEDGKYYQCFAKRINIENGAVDYKKINDYLQTNITSSEILDKLKISSVDASTCILNGNTFYRTPDYPKHIMTSYEDFYYKFLGSWFPNQESDLSSIYISQGLFNDDKVVFVQFHHFSLDKGIDNTASDDELMFDYYCLEEELKKCGFTDNNGVLVFDNNKVKYTMTRNAIGISVTGVEIKPSSLEMVVGEKTSLTATVTPDNAMDHTILWTSDNESVVSVDKYSGSIIAKGSGTTTIRASSSNGITATCTVNVTGPEPESISLNYPSLSFSVQNGNKKLIATINPDEAPKEVKWASSDEGVAIVNSTGNVFPVAFGTATITATTTNGLKAECVVKVKDSWPTSIKVSEENITMKKGESKKISWVIEPENALTGSMTMSSSDSDVAVYTNGCIEARDCGYATITITCYKVSATIQVYVNP